MRTDSTEMTNTPVTVLVRMIPQNGMPLSALSTVAVPVSFSATTAPITSTARSATNTANDKANVSTPSSPPSHH